MTTSVSAPATAIDEIADGLFRVSTPVPPDVTPGGFSFNQYLIVDEAPLVYHTGPRGIFPEVRAAIERILPLSKIRFVAFSHVEADECGALNEFLELAPQAVPLCSDIAAMTSVNDMAIRPARSMADGDVLTLGTHRIRWLATPHVPHGWDCAMAFEEHTGTLLCGDLFTQPGDRHAPVTEGDILESSEAFRRQMDYFANGPDTRRHLTRLARLRPAVLACMHGSAWRGDVSALLFRLADRVSPLPAEVATHPA